MSQIAQVRINKTKEVEEVINFLRSLYKYKLLDDSELIKVALSELYSKAMKDISINNEGHPYYNTLTPEEEIGVAKSLKELSQKNTTSFNSGSDLLQFVKSGK